MTAQPIARGDTTETQLAASRAAEDFAKLREDVAKLSQSVAELVQQQAASATSQMADAYGTARERLVRSAGEAQNKVMSLEAELETKIERNPLSSLAIAIGVGFVVGTMTQPRR
jgi:ElaB/YqjD/DUF883 family membrane-anchored ribosome-binding protein